MKARYIYILALAAALIDQVSKRLILDRLTFDSEIPVAGGLFRLALVHNRGIAFGMFQSSPVPLMITIITVAAIVYTTVRKGHLPKLLSISMGLLFGGAVGNLIDRLHFGYVVDFVDFGFWPVFNFADVAIVSGVFLLAYHMLFCDGKNKDGVGEAISNE